MNLTDDYYCIQVIQIILRNFPQQHEYELASHLSQKNFQNFWKRIYIKNIIWNLKKYR